MAGAISNSTVESSLRASTAERTASALDDESKAAVAAALMAAAAVGFGTNLSIQLLNLGLQSRGVSAALIGFSTMVQAIGIVFAAMLAPAVMRQIGARWTMIAGAVTAAGCMLLFTQVTGWAPVTALRLVYAIGLALVFSCAEFVILSLSKRGDKGRTAGLYAAISGAGMALGPAWISFAGETDPISYYLAAWLCMACIPIASAIGKVGPSLTDQNIRRLPYLSLAPLGFLAAFIFGFIDNGPITLLPVYGVFNDWSGAQSVLLVTAATLGAVVFQWPIGKAVDCFGTGLVFAAGVVAALTLALALPNLWHSPALVFLSVVAIGVVMEGFYTVGLAEIGNKFQANELAGVNAYFIAMCGAGETVGPALTGFALEWAR